MHMLLESVAKERAHWRDKARKCDDAYIKDLIDQIESERDMNDKLTRELMKREVSIDNSELLELFNEITDVAAAPITDWVVLHDHMVDFSKKLGKIVDIPPQI